MAGESLALLVSTRSRMCALPVRHVLETLRPLPVSPVAGMPPFLSGLSVIRGAPTPVVDLGSLLDGATTPDVGRFVSLRLEGQRAALAVESVVGVKAMDSVRLEEFPALLGDAQRERIEAVGLLESRLCWVLRAARLLPPEVWSALEAQGQVEP